jgi:Rrf2 family protein
MQLKTQTDYAIRTMLYLSENHFATKKEMSSALRINEHYLPKIIKPLRDQKWIASSTGSEGGFAMIGDPEKITLLDIIEVMEGPIQFGMQESSDDQVTADASPLNQVYRGYQDYVEQYFSSITLQDLLEQQDMESFLLKESVI